MVKNSSSHKDTLSSFDALDIAGAIRGNLANIEDAKTHHYDQLGSEANAFGQYPSCMSPEEIAIMDEVDAAISVLESIARRLDHMGRRKKMLAASAKGAKLCPAPSIPPCSRH